MTSSEEVRRTLSDRDGWGLRRCSCSFVRRRATSQISVRRLYLSHFSLSFRHQGPSMCHGDGLHVDVVVQIRSRNNIASRTSVNSFESHVNVFRGICTHASESFFNPRWLQPTMASALAPTPLDTSPCCFRDSSTSPSNRNTAACLAETKQLVDGLSCCSHTTDYYTEDQMSTCRWYGNA
jgi:hypothetical protein